MFPSKLFLISWCQGWSTWSKWSPWSPHSSWSSCSSWLSCSVHLGRLDHLADLVCIHQSPASCCRLWGQAVCAWRQKQQQGLNSKVLKSFYKNLAMMTLWFSLEGGGIQVSYHVMFIIFKSLPTGGADHLRSYISYILTRIYHIYHIYIILNICVFCLQVELMSAEKFDPQTGKWEMVKEMHRKRQH